MALRAIARGKNMVLDHISGQRRLICSSYGGLFQVPNSQPGEQRYRTIVRDVEAAATVSVSPPLGLKTLDSLTKNNGFSTFGMYYQRQHTMGFSCMENRRMHGIGSIRSASSIAKCGTNRRAAFLWKGHGFKKGEQQETESVEGTPEKSKVAADQDQGLRYFLEKVLRNSRLIVWRIVQVIIAIVCWALPAIIWGALEGFIFG